MTTIRRNPTNPTAPTHRVVPAFDKEAARRRYRATMRGPFMRSLYVLLALVILAAWGLGIGAVFARDVEHLPGTIYRWCPAAALAAIARRPATPRRFRISPFQAAGFAIGRGRRQGHSSHF